MADEKQNCYKGLTALFTDMFSKKCNCCGKSFTDVQNFINQTVRVAKGTGLQDTKDEDGVIVELYRTCDCGSTLMLECKDRRDTSVEGQKRRHEYALFIVPQESI